ncbi:DUF4189 domain-containing protein [Sphingomonas panni]
MRHKAIGMGVALAVPLVGLAMLHHDLVDAQVPAPPFICNGVRQGSPNCPPPTPVLKDFFKLNRSFGPLAYDDAKGNWFGSYQYPSKRAAQDGVMDNCAANGGTACRLMLSYTNQCAAVARAVQDGRDVVGHDSVDTGSTQDEAVANVRRSCQSDWGTQSCSIKLVNCSHHDVVKWSEWVYE